MQLVCVVNKAKLVLFFDTFIRDLENQAKDFVSRLKNIKVHGLYARFMSVLGFVQECRVRKYAKFGVFYAKIVQMTPQRLRRESLRLQKFSVTNREPLRLQKFSVTNTVLSLPFSQQIQFTLIVNVVNLN